MARRKRHEAWSDSVDDALMYRRSDGLLGLRWNLWLPDGTPKAMHSHMVPGSPNLAKGSRSWDAKQEEMRRRARAKTDAARKRLQDEEAARQGKRIWHLEDRASDYVGRWTRAPKTGADGRPEWHGHWEDSITDGCVSAQRLAQSTRLRPSTKHCYRRCLNKVADLLDDPPKDASGARPAPYTIADLLDVDKVEALLREAERRHGTETAKDMAGVMSRYVYRYLMRDGIAEKNPLDVADIEWAGVERGNTRRARAKRAGELEKGDVICLTRDERVRVIEWLLAQGDCKMDRGRGGYTAEERTYHRRCLVDMALVQTTMGLRACECVRMQAKDVSFLADGRVVIDIPEGKSKTRRGRTVPNIDRDYALDVSERMRERLKGLHKDDHVFASCKDGRSEWTSSTKSLRRFYDEMADATGIEALKVACTHVWRATINTEMFTSYRRGETDIDDVLRTELFGHTLAVNQNSYTGDITPEEIVGLAAPKRSFAGRGQILEGPGLRKAE